MPTQPTPFPHADRDFNHSPSRMTFHFMDDPDGHRVELDGYSWEDVQAIAVNLGPGTLSYEPTATLTCYVDHPFRLVGRCRPVAGLPADKLVDIEMSFGDINIQQKLRTQPPTPVERPVCYINGHEIKFQNARLWVMGGQQVFLQIDRLVEGLPGISGDMQGTQWLGFYLVRGRAGTDVPAFPPRHNTPRLEPDLFTLDEFWLAGDLPILESEGTGEENEGEEGTVQA